MTDLAPLTGEHLALDLINTRPAPGDLLATTAGLHAWLALEAARLPGAESEVTAADLADVHAVREHIATAIDHARHKQRPPEATLRALTEAQRAAAPYRELSWQDGAVTATTRRPGTLGARLAAQLAEAAADLLTDPAITRIRECEAHDCVMLFLPAHPRRRWCSTSRCGNRARVARHYHRHKTP